MPDLELLPPNVEITSDLNLRVRVRVLAQVLLELFEGCGVTNFDETLKKGIIDYHIFERITLSFINCKNVIKGEIDFCIDWNALELSAKTNNDITLLQKLDVNKLISRQLDPNMCRELFDFVERLKGKHEIVRTRTTFSYRNEYKDNDENYKQTMAFLGHSISKSYEKETSDFNLELEAVFKGLEDSLRVIMRK